MYVAEEAFLEQVEQISPKERIDQYVDVEIRDWINGEWRQNLKNITKVSKHERASGPGQLRWNMQNINAFNDLNNALYCMVEGRDPADPYDWQVIEGWDRLIQNDIYGTQPSSLVNECKGEMGKSDLQAHFLGNRAVLTALQLVRSSRPQEAGDLRPSIIVTDARTDALGKLDLKFEFGDTNPYMEGNPEIIRYAQIKHVAKGQPWGVWRVDRDSNYDRSEYVRNGIVTTKDVQQMLRTADAIEQEYSEDQRPDVEVFVLAIPTHEATVFGLLKQTGEAKQFARDFESMASKCNFLPSTKGGS